jgi:hypothetical protein
MEIGAPRGRFELPSPCGHKLAGSAYNVPGLRLTGLGHLGLTAAIPLLPIKGYLAY